MKGVLICPVYLLYLVTHETNVAMQIQGRGARGWQMNIMIITNKYFHVNMTREGSGLPQAPR